MYKYLYLFLVPMNAWAVDPKAAPIKNISSGEAIPTGSPATVLLGLIAVVGLIFFLAWLVKQYNKTGFMVNSTMKVVSTLSIGVREKVVLIEIADKQILLGVAPGSVNQLHVFDEKVVNQEASKPSEFANKLKHFIQTSQKPDQSSTKSVD